MSNHSLRAQQPQHPRQHRAHPRHRIQTPFLDLLKALFVLNQLLRTDKPPLAGFVVEENQQLTLRLVGQNSVVTKSEILSREKSPISMMPLVHAVAQIDSTPHRESARGAAYV